MRVPLLACALAQAGQGMRTSHRIKARFSRDALYMYANTFKPVIIPLRDA